MHPTPKLLLLVILGFAAHVLAEPWRTTVLIEAPRGLGGAAAGDLDPRSPGPELVAVDGSGAIWMARQTDTGWQSQRLHQAAGELIMGAIGDVDPAYPGNEFVGVGMVEGPESLSGAGQVLMLSRKEGAWHATQLLEDTHMIHGVAIGDVSRRHDGAEIISCGFNHRVKLLAKEGDRWHSETIYVGNNRMKIAAVGDVLPDREGLEVVVSGMDGKALVLWEDKLGWRHEVIYNHAAGQSRIACAPNLVLIGGDDGQVTLAQRDRDGWHPTFLMRDTAKIRGIALGQSDGSHQLPACFACGYGRGVHRLTQGDDGYWRNEQIYVSEKPLHHLLAADLDPDSPGLELVVCGHAGRAVLLSAP